MKNMCPHCGAENGKVCAPTCIRTVTGSNALGIQPGRVHWVGKPPEPEGEYTGGSVSYYSVRITSPTSGGDAYTAECNDIIEALGMNYAEGNAFKAIWRACAARTLGKVKRGYKGGLYDAEKVVFFGQRMVEQSK